MDLKFFEDMFALGAPVLEKILRPIIVYIFLIVSLRLSGKRELAQLNPFDFVVLLTLSNTVQNAIIGNDNSVSGGIIGAATLLLVNYLVVRFFYRHEKIERLVEGAPDVLIDHGKVQYKNLRKELITLAELQIAAHKQGFASLDDIAHATIEPDGVITFIGKVPPSEVVRHREIMERFRCLEERLPEKRKKEKESLPSRQRKKS